MKPINTLILLASLAGGQFGPANAQTAAQPATNAPPATTGAAAEQTPQPADAAATVTNPPPAITEPTNSVATTTNDAAADFAAGKGLRMNFRQVPLDMVLSYMSKAAGFIIHTSRGVNVQGKVDVWADQPMTKAEAVTLLKQMMSENGYAVLENGERVLTIIPTLEAKKNDLKVQVAKDPADIVKNSEMVTEIIPVSSLNVVQLARDLSPMLDNPLTAQESGNSLIMTDTQTNVRRIVEIVKALDSVSSSVNSIEVFQLVYADAKTLASLIKDLFPSADTTGRGAGGTQRFGNRGGGGGGRGGGGGGFPGGGGGFPGGGFAALFGGGGGGDSSGSTPTTRVSAVSDDHSNSLIVSAPDNLMELIRSVVKQVDVSVQDITDVKVFKLKNADATETADLLTTLFPDDSGSYNATAQQFNFGGFGGFGGGRGGAGGARGGAGGRGNTAAATSSDRLQKMTRVVAVPDRRTSSVVVCAAKVLMPDIEKMIQELDENPAKKVKLFAIPLQYADPQEIQQTMQDLVPATTTGGRSGSSSTTTTSPLQTRATTLLNQQNSTTTSGIGGSTTGGGRIGN